MKCYLRSLLEGSAKECIEGLSRTVANYNEAIKILQERFANPQVIVSAHMECLVKLSVIRDVKDLVGLRKNNGQVESCVRNLKTMRIVPESYGALLVPMLNEKLPPELRMLIDPIFTTDVWKLEDMLTYFKEELQAKEICSAVTVRSQSPSRKNYEPSATSAFHVYSKHLCVFCKMSHSPSKCPKVTSVSARRGILRKTARYFICLKPGHK